MEMEKLLSGGDLRSISKVNEIVEIISTQQQFDGLFEFVTSSDRLLRMRSMDAIEKITRQKPECLNAHKEEILRLCEAPQTIEIKWQLA